MPCCIGCLALSMPRVAIVVLVIFSDYIGQAYDGRLWPLLGFFFLPLTTLTYAWAMHRNAGVDGIYLAALVVAVMIDLGLIRLGSRPVSESSQPARDLGPVEPLP